METFWLENKGGREVDTFNNIIYAYIPLFVLIFKKILKFLGAHDCKNVFRILRIIILQK